MLIRFSVANYKSFYEETSLNMVKTKERNHPHHINNDTSGDFKTLKSAIIYGANASGKSNLIKALAFFQSFVLNGRKRNQSIGIEHFLLSGKSGEPSSFEVEFKINKKAYAFGFKATDNEIKEEWLYQIYYSEQKPEKLIYYRKGQKLKEYGKSLPEKTANYLKERIPEAHKSILFITKAFEDSFDQFKNVNDWFKNLRIITPHHSLKADIFLDIDNDNDFRKFIASSLKYLDTGIVDVSIKKVHVDSLKISTKYIDIMCRNMEEGQNVTVPYFLTNGEKILFQKKKGKIQAEKLFTHHKTKNNKIKKFDLKDESDGTKRIVDLLPLFYQAEKAVLVIDELDRSLHPEISNYLVNHFLQNKEKNDSQLIITTHETSLLNTATVRRDEIWFVEKNKEQSSKLYSLSSFDQRYDKEIRKAYLTGRFGAVPKIHEHQNG
ncbi:MAG: ATP-binding protein [Alphaproteobacteria bacterium]|nr:ATP-binding protein [Alphaproteobacteria bacterium]